MSDGFTNLVHNAWVSSRAATQDLGNNVFGQHLLLIRQRAALQADQGPVIKRSFIHVREVNLRSLAKCMFRVGPASLGSAHPSGVPFYAWVPDSRCSAEAVGESQAYPSGREKKCVRCFWIRNREKYKPQLVYNPQASPSALASVFQPGHPHKIWCSLDDGWRYSK